jgi:signal transduction histidine kinase
MLPWLQKLTARHGLHDLLTRNVLIIDDEPLNLDVLESLLESSYRLHLAQSGVAGLQIAETTPIDVVITDQRMPMMTGTEVLERIRRVKPDIAGIVLTAYSDTPALLSAINEARAFRYLKKPWQPEEMLAALADACDQVEQTRAMVHLTDLLARRTDELSRALEELRAAQQTVLHMQRLSDLGRFAAGVVHDLRNGLTCLMGLTWELDELALPPDMIEGVELSLGGLRSLLDQLESVYQYARSNRLEVQLESVDAGELVEGALKIVRMDLRSRTRDIQLRVRGALPRVSADRMKLIQVIINLVRNAVQATVEQQSIWVELSASADGQVVISVEDEGPGIAAEIRPRLFSAFASNKGVEGMGMGLYMSKMIVEAHHGAIECFDRAPTGTRFEIRIPSESVRPDEASRAQRGQGEHVGRRREFAT